MLRAEATIYVRKNNVLCRQVIAHIVKFCLAFPNIKKIFKYSGVNKHQSDKKNLNYYILMYLNL